MTSCHGLDKPCEKYACKVEMLIKCPCQRREAFVECLAKKKRLKHVLKCNEVCENFKRFKGIYQRVRFFYRFLSNLSRKEEKRPITQLC